jgi:hypothetical protein
MVRQAVQAVTAVLAEQLLLAEQLALVVMAEQVEQVTQAALSVQMPEQFKTYLIQLPQSLQPAALQL